MEADWDSASFGEGTLKCLLCKEALDYVNGDGSDLSEHLKDVHRTKIHHNLILAITFLDNKTLNNIISQFEKETKSVGDQIADIFGIDSRDEGLLEETDTDLDASVVEIVDEKDAVEVDDEEEVKKRELNYEDIINSSDYFKRNPKQLTKKCNIDLHSGDIFTSVDPKLPPGWKVRDHEKQNGASEKHFLSPDGRVIKSKRAVIEYMKIMEKYSVKNIISVPKTKEKPIDALFGSLWNHLSSNETDDTKQSLPKKRGRPSLASKASKQYNEEENQPQDDSEKVSEAKKRKSAVNKDSKQDDDSDIKKRRSGVGTECPECHKIVSMPKQHMEDMHSPPGHFPCRGCGKVFTSKNKESSHYSRHCKPKK